MGSGSSGLGGFAVRTLLRHRAIVALANRQIASPADADVERTTATADVLGIPDAPWLPSTIASDRVAVASDWVRKGRAKIVVMTCGQVYGISGCDKAQEGAGCRWPAAATFACSASPLQPFGCGGNGPAGRDLAVGWSVGHHTRQSAGVPAPEWHLSAGGGSAAHPCGGGASGGPGIQPGRLVAAARGAQSGGFRIVPMGGLSMTALEYRMRGPVAQVDRASAF